MDHQGRRSSEPRHLRVAITGLGVTLLVLTTAGPVLAKPLGKQAWRQEVRAICAQIDKDLDAAAEVAFAEVDPESGPTEEQLAAATTQFIPVIRAAVNSIVALDEPVAYRKNVKRFRAAVFRGLAVLEDDPSNDDASLFDDADRFATKLGIGSCP